MNEILATDDVGAAVPEGMIAVENPATGASAGSVPQMSGRQVDEMADRAREAQLAWQASGFSGRARLMYELRHWLVRNRRRMIETIVSETGKTPDDALLTEIVYVADSLGFWAKNARKYLTDEKVRTHSPFLLGKKVVVRHRPLGVVGVIAPWNYPLTLGFGDAIPALMAGNSVILKPSEQTPLCSLLIAEAAREVGFPRDVFQVATGDGTTGAAVVEAADMVMFTGSTRTGRKIGARCGERLIPCALELGGKDAMIVLRDADLERAANVAVEWAMRHNGQMCMAVERVYVEEPVYDDFVAKVVAKTSGLRQGAPGRSGTVDLGAITFPPQMDVINSHVDDAIAKGARILTGGKSSTDRGRFFEPTVIVDVDHTMNCMTDETFGPTLPIMKVRDERQAIELANDSEYGLGSSVFTRDIARGERIARQLDAGVTWINDAIMSYLAQEAPFGGSKSSGVGARHGADGIRKYTQAQTILTTRFAPRREFTMLPVSKRRARVLDRLLVLLYGRRKRRT